VSACERPGNCRWTPNGEELCDACAVRIWRRDGDEQVEREARERGEEPGAALRARIDRLYLRLFALDDLAEELLGEVDALCDVLGMPDDYVPPRREE
jgi:hypothetical protein